MAKGKKTGGRDFPKGHKFGKGAPKIPTELKELRKDNILLYTQLITELTHLTTEQLEAIAKDKTQNIMRAYIASSLLKSYSKGEPNRFEYLADRALGKVKQDISHSGTIINLTLGEREKKL